jgi:hypothetical protein
MLNGAAAAALSVSLLSGCQEAPASRTVPKFAAQTPEQKLELVMQRFDSALADAAAARGSGVISERKSSYKLIPPGEGDEPYRAEVTIRTTVALANAPAALPLRAKKETEPDSLAADEDDKFSIAKNEDDESLEGDELIPDNGVTRRAAEQSKDVKTDVYELVYSDDRWTLPAEPTDEVAKYLFEFALRN